MGVNHRRADVFVAQQFLHRANVVATLEQMCGEGMSKRVTCRWFREAGRTNGILHGRLQHAFGNVVSLSLTRTRIDAKTRGRKDILLAPFPSSIRVLSQ